MERRNAIKWLNSLKIAVINEDLDTLSKIAFLEVPKFENISNMRIAKKLVVDAMDIIVKEQDKISKFLIDYRKFKKYGDNIDYNRREEWVG